MMKRKQSKPDILQQILDRLTKIESLQAKDHKLLLKVNKRLNNVIQINNLQETKK